MSKNQEAGFTLFELIAMIIIIAILAGVAVPKFISLSEEAKHANCITNQVVLQNAALVACEHNALAGTPGYPATLDDVEQFITSGYTTKCADETTDLIYDSSNGSVRCPNHSRF